MAGRSPAEAVQSFFDPLQDALSCVTDPVLNAHGGYHASPGPLQLTLRDGEPVRLDTESRLSLVVIHRYVVRAEGQRGPWKVSTTAYLYELYGTEDRALVRYHWHPRETEHVAYAHLHIGLQGKIERRDADKFHFPTGRIAGRRDSLGHRRVWREA